MFDLPQECVFKLEYTKVKNLSDSKKNGFEFYKKFTENNAVKLQSLYTYSEFAFTVIYKIRNIIF